MKNLKFYFFILTLVLFDQITKVFFIGKNFFIFNYVQNTGIAFGLLKGYNLVFIFLSLLVIFFVIYTFNRYKNLKFIFSLILAGAFGNLIDRIFRGYVIDFIDFRIWPVFNFADAFVTVGALLLFIKLIKEKD